MSTKISVIVPIYNVEKLLPRCLDSILAQTHRNLEVILVDDGSPDRSGEIADSYANKDSRVMVIHQENAGSAEARRKGVNMATGEYVMFVDSDDEIPPTAASALHQRCQESDLDLAFGAYKRIYGDKTAIVENPQTGIFTGEEFLTVCLQPNTILTSNCMSLSKREIWLHDDVFPPSDTKYPSEDFLTNILLTKHIRRAGIYNDVVYHYYYNPNSQSISNRIGTQSGWKSHFQIIRDNLQERGVFERNKRLFRMCEIDRIFFYIFPLDTKDEWIQSVIGYPSKDFPKKTRLCQRLLKHPHLRPFLIRTNRALKGALGFMR